MNINRVFLMLVTPLFLAACERDRIPDLCEDPAALCVELHQGKSCRVERTALIHAHGQHASAPGDQSDYHLIQTLQQYRNCLAPWLVIKDPQHQERKNDKVEVVIQAKEAITQLASRTAQSDDPYLLLWHWQYQSSHQAKARFIQLAERPEMQQPELQKVLAAFLLLRNSQAAEQALHHALSLYDQNAAIDTDIIATLLTLYIRERRYQEVWVWSRVLQRLDHSSTISLDRMNAYAHFTASEQQSMQQDVERILTQLKAGNYRRG
ncbi:DUF2989 domain-containing protein [Oceanisphaera sp.]|uniref:DUF2989 domain-containing protein n=1 Tax=Oceanisphaera sp. TaxID=1929979 RepID=UPI003A910D29